MPLFTRAISPLSRNPPLLAGPLLCPLPAVATSSHTRPSLRLLASPGRLVLVPASTPPPPLLLFLHPLLARGRTTRERRMREKGAYVRARDGRTVKWERGRGGGGAIRPVQEVCALIEVSSSTRWIFPLVAHAFFFVSSRTIMILLR